MRATAVPSRRRRRPHPFQLSLSDLFEDALDQHGKVRGGRLRALAGAIVLDQDGGMLLLHRAGPPQWELPGGKVEPGESLEEAAVRELAEELGVRLRKLSYIGDTRFRQQDHGWRYAWFLAEEIDGEPAVCEPDRFDNVAYWPISELTRMMSELSPNVRLLVRAYFEGRLVLPRRTSTRPHTRTAVPA